MAPRLGVASLPGVRKRLSPSNPLYRLRFYDAITAIPFYEAYLVSRHSRGIKDDDRAVQAVCAE